MVHVEPLDYQLQAKSGRLAMRISNPTAERVTLLSDRSYAVDPLGESHPVAGRVIGPHSYAQLYFPPVPFSYAYPDYPLWGPGWGGVGWGWYDPLWGPAFGPAFIGPPPLTYYEVRTAYDWQWKSGSAQIHLFYQRDGNSFDHLFELVRERKR